MKHFLIISNQPISFLRICSRRLMLVLQRSHVHDYVSSMHILAPLFEKTFNPTDGVIGEADTVGARIQNGSSDQIWTQDKTLGEEFLKDEKVRQIWGENFCEQISFTMFAPLGYKIRHKIASLVISANEFNFRDSTSCLIFSL